MSTFVRSIPIISLLLALSFQCHAKALSNVDETISSSEESKRPSSYSTYGSVLDRVGDQYLMRANEEDTVEFVRGIYKKLHEIPELMFEEEETSALIQRTLEDLSVDFRAKIAHTGVVASIGSGRPPVVALRADIDALPIHEDADVAFQSRHPGRMHACGHDAHVAMLLGAAKILKEQEEQLPGTVLLLFQPAEEGGAGAKKMVEEGALGEAEMIFGLHVSPTLETGRFGGRSGAFMAGAGCFSAVISGKGGHGAAPHRTKDPILAASSVVNSLQALISRETDPIESQVVSVTQIHGGSAYNVIPDSVTISGTFRSFSSSGLLALKRRIEDVIVLQASAMGCNASVSFLEESRPLYPPTINHAEAFQLARAVATDLVGENEFVELPPTMGAEDFAFYGERIPGVFLFLGIRNETTGYKDPVHTSKFRVNLEGLPFGVAMHCAFVWNFFRRGL